jgi:hypothetical protein
VLAQGDVDLADDLGQTVVQHSLGAIADLLGGLEHGDHGAVPVGGSAREKVDGSHSRQVTWTS